MLIEKTETTALTIPALRMIRSDGVGPVTFRRLVAHFGGIEAALASMPHMKKPIQPADLSRIQAEDKALRKLRGHWIMEG